MPVVKVKVRVRVRVRGKVTARVGVRVWAVARVAAARAVARTVARGRVWSGAARCGGIVCLRHPHHRSERGVTAE